MRLTNAAPTANPPGDDRTTEPTGSRSGPAGAPSARPGHWRPDIEGLRAVAVGAVIAAHIGFFHAGGGYIGVDVFFVISGFLITSLLLREIGRTGRVSLTGFYARRAVRLLPAAAVVLLATLLASWIWLPRTRLHDIAADAAAATLNVVNIRLAQTGTDYLNAETDPSPLQHFWSLAVEEQFYIVWPLLLLGIALAARRVWGGTFARKGHLHRRRTAAIAVVLVLIAAGSFYLSATRTGTDPVWSYFGIHTRAWELAVGALIAVGATRIQRLPRPVAALASWAGLALIVASVLVLDDHTVFPGTAAALPVAGAALVIAAGCVPHRFGATTLLGIAPAQYIGKISYGLYLWHWPLIMIGPALLGIEEPRLRHYLALMAAAFVLAVATFHLVENPIRTRRPLVQVPSRALAMGGGLITATLAASFLMVLQPMPTVANGDAEEITGDDTTVWEVLGESSDVDTVPANVTPPLDAAGRDEPALYAEDCVVERDSAALAEGCQFGDPDGEKTVVLFGDSHAAQWFPALNQIAEASGWKLVPFAKANCSVADVTERDKVLERRYTECEDWKDKAFAEIETLEPDVVVAASYEDKEIIADDPVSAWADGWTESLNRLDESADRVYYLADSPNPPGDTPSCLAENPEKATACVATVEESITRPDLRAAAIEAVEDQTEATIVDPLPWLCDTERDACPVIIGNLLVYRDWNHLAARFVAELTPQLAAAIPLEAQPADAR